MRKKATVRKELTLNETWKRCLSMWRYVAKERAGRPDVDVEDLKLEYIDRYHPEDYDIYGSCYLCDFAINHEDDVLAPKKHCEFNLACPAKIISPSFDCCNKSYHYKRHPAAFLRKLEQLNKKRREMKK